jgi:hypothetical protein
MDIARRDIAPARISKAFMPKKPQHHLLIYDSELDLT